MKLKTKKKNMNNEIFKTYFGYHTPSFLVKDFYKVNKYKKEKIVNQINDSLNKFKNSVVGKEIPEKEILNKVINIVGKIFDFHK